MSIIPDCARIVKEIFCNFHKFYALYGLEGNIALLGKLFRIAACRSVNGQLGTLADPTAGKSFLGNFCDAGGNDNPFQRLTSGKRLIGNLLHVGQAYLDQCGAVFADFFVFVKRLSFWSFFKKFH